MSKYLKVLLYSLNLLICFTCYDVFVFNFNCNPMIADIYTDMAILLVANTF